jgi:tetratricopeptide (TPR) repeat protein
LFGEHGGGLRFESIDDDYKARGDGSNGQDVVKTRRRSARQLANDVAAARGRSAKALAYYQLALFHDNNSREREAIPNYQRAIKLGLPRATKAAALAWLASSLYKTGSSKAAIARLNQSAEIAMDLELLQFLEGLRRRIRAYSSRRDA